MYTELVKRKHQKAWDIKTNGCPPPPPHTHTHIHNNNNRFINSQYLFTRLI